MEQGIRAYRKRGDLDLQSVEATPVAGERREAECAPDFARDEVRGRNSSWKREKASAKAEEGSVEREGDGGAAVGLNRARRTRRLKMRRLCSNDRWVIGPRGSG